MPALEELIRMRVVVSDPGMDEVVARRDLPYRTIGDETLRMDVYAPAGPATARPTILFVHGGPIPKLGAKNMGVFRSYGELLAASGFTAVTFDHRFLAPDRLTDAAGDVEDLVGHVRDEASALGVDPERMALWAFSGGGSLLASFLRERPPWLRAVLAFYAALDLREPPAGADSGVGPELRRRFSAAAALEEGERGAPPLLVARAGLDHPWLNAGIDRFVRAALEKDATLDLLTHPEGRHGFDILDDDPRSRSIIRRAVAFLHEHLDP